MIAGVKIKRLTVYPDERGRLMEILRRDDGLYSGFGQAYITTAYPGVVKAWHYHARQIDNFTCLSGTIKLVLFDNREDSPTSREVDELFLGIDNRMLVQIPVGVYHGFKCVGLTEAVVLNIPSEPYDHKQPDEFRVPPHDPSVPYDWSLNER
jgi:dTDP-4-dehydrorhamnose 3,5-epimerase